MRSSRESLTFTLNAMKTRLIRKFNLRAFRFLLLLVSDFKPNVADVVQNNGKWQTADYLYDVIASTVVKKVLNKSGGFESLKSNSAAVLGFFLKASNYTKLVSNPRAAFKDLTTRGISQSDARQFVSVGNAIRVVKLKNALVARERALFASLPEDFSYLPADTASRSQGFRSKLRNIVQGSQELGDLRKLRRRCERGQRKVAREESWTLRQFRASMLTTKQDFLQRRNLSTFSRQALHFVRVNGTPRTSVEEICKATYAYGFKGEFIGKALRGT